jgi:hypothetical protein
VLWEAARLVLAPAEEWGVAIAKGTSALEPMRLR